MGAATCRHAVPRGYLSDWQCERRRFHLGRHRWRNYTRPRFPHFWKLDLWRRTLKCNRRLRGYEKDGTAPMLVSHRTYLFPARFDPIPVAQRVLAG